MNHLVKHFLRRVGLKITLIFGLIAAMNFLGIWQFTASKLEQAWCVGFMIAGGFGLFVAIVFMQADEFDLVLPVRRRRLSLAQNLAALMLVIVMAAPVTATALAVAFLQGDRRESLQPCATFASIWIAMLLTALPLVRLLKRMRSPSVMGMGFGFGMLIPFCLVLMMALKGKLKTSGFLVSAVSVFAIALAWFLCRRQFERYELIPSGDAGAAPNTGARSGFTDRFSPMVRILAHALWLRWWYPVVLFMVAFYSLIFTAKQWPDVWVFWLIYAGCGGSVIQLLSGTGQSLLPYVPRRTILRSVLAPIAATPLLIGGIKAITVHSAPMILLGLAIALLTVGVTWFALPSAKEFGRPFLVALRRNLSMIPLLGFFVSAFVPVVKRFITGLLAITWSNVSPWINGNSVLACSVIVLAIVLLWWGCERKVRYFEPGAFPSVSNRAV